MSAPQSAPGDGRAKPPNLGRRFSGIRPSSASPIAGQHRLPAGGTPPWNCRSGGLPHGRMSASPDQPSRAPETPPPVQRRRTCEGQSNAGFAATVWSTTAIRLQGGRYKNPEVRILVRLEPRAQDAVLAHGTALGAGPDAAACLTAEPGATPRHRQDPSTWPIGDSTDHAGSSSTQAWASRAGRKISYCTGPSRQPRHRSLADPCVAACHVIARLPDLSNYSVGESPSRLPGAQGDQAAAVDLMPLERVDRPSHRLATSNQQACPSWNGSLVPRLWLTITPD